MIAFCRNPKNWFALILAGFWAASTVRLLHHVHAAIVFPYQLDYGESVLLHQSQRLLQGENLYALDTAVYPSLVSSYPPVFIAIWSSLHASMGPSYVSGRILTVIALFVCAMALFWIVYQLTRTVVAALTATTLFLTSPYVFLWSALARVDFVALAFTLVGLAVIIRPPSRGTLIVGALLMTCATFTRQSYGLAGPIAAMSWLVIYDRWLAVGFGAVFAGTLLVLFGGIQWFTGGFFQHIIVSHFTDFSLLRAGDFVFNLIVSSFLSIGMVIAHWEWSVPSRKPKWQVLYLYGMAGLVSGISAGRSGSEVNYWLEVVVGFALILGTIVGHLSDPRVSGRNPALWQVLLLVQISWSFLYSSQQFDPVRFGYSLQGELRSLHQLVANTPGPILADHFLGVLLTSKHEIYLQTFDFQRLVAAGLGDVTLLDQQIRSGCFALILVTNQPPFPHSLTTLHWRPTSLAAIEDAYQSTQVLAGTTVYTPLHPTDCALSSAVGRHH